MEMYTPRKNRKWLVPFFILMAVFIAAAVTAYASWEQREAYARELNAIDTTDHAVETSGKNIWQNARVLKGGSIKTSVSEEAGNDTYVTPEGFKIISHSKKWRGEKLKEVYRELLNNAHGVELQYINSVIISPKKEEQGESAILGTQQSQDTSFEVSVNLPAFIPDGARYRLDSSTSDITLYNMDSYDTIAEAARTIAHEYGHHFTRFYFFENEKDYLHSDYYKIRGLKDYSKAKIYQDAEDYQKYYEWDILEMAAEDYVQLLGSKNAKQSQKYNDISQWLRSGKKNYSLDVKNYYYNVYPQDNIFIPLASQVKGLDTYFHSFLKDGFTTKYKEYPDLKLKFKKSAKNGYTYYTVTWNAIPGLKDAMYTLLCYNTDGSLFMPVKTVMGGGKMSAVVGTPSYVSGSYIYYWSDNIPRKDRIFKVTVLLGDGTVIASKPQKKSF